MYELSFGQFLFVLVISAAVSMAVFAHAEKQGNRHATAWGIATFLALGIAVPVYFVRHWLRTRSRR